MGHQCGAGTRRWERAASPRGRWSAGSPASRNSMRSEYLGIYICMYHYVAMKFCDRERRGGRRPRHARGRISRAARQPAGAGPPRRRVSRPCWCLTFPASYSVAQQGSSRNVGDAHLVCAGLLCLLQFGGPAHSIGRAAEGRLDPGAYVRRGRSAQQRSNCAQLGGRAFCSRV